jgi:subfamily B ATP-binding cassette protein MsbA
MTGVSATTAGSTVIVGIIGMLMIWLGGRAIIAGEMTLGDLMMYIFFIGLVAAPLVSIASIGTQITEAFAGLDRIREILDMTPSSTRIARAPVERLRGDVAFDTVWFEYNPGSRCCAACPFSAPGTTPRWSDRADRARAR